MCHVLIIEDEWLISDYIQDLAMQAGGTSFDTAMTQAGAMQCAADHRPDIILSDVLLANGTGPLAVEAILRIAGPIPVIFITGTPEHCMPCDPPSVILGKPIDSEAVISTFRELMLAA